MTRKAEDAQQADEMQLKDAVRNSAQQIWLAGLGAFATAREEGGGIFSRLVKEGGSLPLRTQQLAGQKISGVFARMTATIGRQAAGPLGRMEEVVGQRVTRTLRNFGVPTQDDLLTLTREIEDLRKAVTALSNVGTRARKAGGKSREAASAKSGPRKPPSGARGAAVLKRQAKPGTESRA